MTRTERQDLLQICRQRERVAKGDAVARAARLKAEFEEQLAREYSWDESEVWKAASAAAKDIIRQCNAQSAAECDRRGIPRWAQPGISEPYWHGRGQNASRERRMELTRV